MIGALVLHGLLIVGMGILYVTTYSFPSLAIGGKLGPGFWPRSVALLGIGLTLVSASQTIRGRRRMRSGPDAAGPAGDSEPAEGPAERPLAMGRFWLAVAIFAAFGGVLGLVGFVVAATALAGTTIWLIGLKSKIWSAAAPLLIGLGFAMLFGRVLQVALPRGIGIFRELSYYLY